MPGITPEQTEQIHIQGCGIEPAHVARVMARIVKWSGPIRALRRRQEMLFHQAHELGTESTMKHKGILRPDVNPMLGLHRLDGTAST